MTTLVSLDEGRPLGGAEKVAAVLLGLDREASSRILKHFDQQELRRIARVAASLGAIPAARLEQLYNGLIEEISDGEIDLVGGVAQAENLIAGVLPEEQVADIMSEVGGRSNQFFWRRIAAMPEKTLADYLVKEHPQTVAVILGRLDSALAAKVLALAPAGLRADSMRRMLISRPLAEPVLRVIEDALQEDFCASAATPSSKEISARVAGIVNQLEREQVNEILDGIAQSEPLLAAQLKSLIFSFEDIVKLGQRARLIIFDQAPTDRVILALRGAEAAVRDAVLPCLSARTRRMVEAELASPAEPSRQEVVAAQREIANLVLRLADQGLIELAGDDPQLVG